MNEPELETSTPVVAVPPELEEIAEDMVQVLERLVTLEQCQTEILTRLAELSRQAQEHQAAQVRVLEALRRDLVGERNALAARGAFNAITPVLDSLQVMRQSLDQDHDTATYAQTVALCSSLSGLLQTLGFAPFQPAEGEAFDPNRMECLGHITGEPGQVLTTVHSGYLAGSAVVRPAGVLIAKPTSPGQANRELGLVPDGVPSPGGPEATACTSDQPTQDMEEPR